MSVLMQRLERHAPWIGGLLLAAPILVFRYPPMGDLAMHEALVAIMRHHGDPAWAPPGMYFVVVPQANQLFHVLAYALSFVLGTTLACKLVVALTVLLTPVGMARLLERLQLSRAYALLLGPIVCGWMFRWGLVANLVGFTVFVFALPLLEQLARRPTPRRAVLGGAVSGLAFFAHESSALILAMVAGYFLVVRGGGLRRSALRCVPLVVPLILALVQLRISKNLAGATMQAVGSDYGLDPLERFRIVPGGLFGGYDATRLFAMTSVWLAALVAGAVARGKPDPNNLRLRVALWRHRYPVLAALFFAMFLLFPMSLGGTTLLAHRFLPAAAVALVLSCAPRQSRLASLLLTAAVPLVMLGIEMKSFVEADRRYRDLDEVLTHLPDNVAVAQLDLTPMAASVVAPVPGAASRALSAHGGRMLFAMTDMPPNPVYVPRARQWNEPMLRMAQAPYAFMPDHDGRRFAFLLARGTKPRYRALAAAALAPEMVIVASAGEWDLFRSTLPVGAIDAPDAPLPSPPPSMLVDRFNRLLPKR